MKGIELPATLALLLRADLRSPAEREGERVLERSLTFDFAADIAVRRLWEKELESGSYYGFNLSLLDAAKC